MLFIAGFSPRVKQIGFAAGLCPACREEVDFHLLRRAQTLSFFFVPLIPLNSSYLATCPRCASVSEVDREAGRAVERGHRHRLAPGELHLHQNNRGLFCEHCRAPVERGQNFCPNCGQRLG